MKKSADWYCLLGVSVLALLFLVFLLGLGGCASSPTRSYSTVRVGDSHDQFVRWSQTTPF